MITVSELNSLCANTLIEHLGIEFTEIGENGLKARMPVDKRTLQPMGILHGGASLAFAETIAGAGSLALVDVSKFNIVGFQVSANHIGTISEGYVNAHATLTHNGTRTHIWDVVISADDGRKISICRVSNMLVEKK
ncbi:hotdog fold thioesterase [Perlabentimonas gracilis]|uniref:hotdog fold thioesterase n=1 Tax=Perlabentimonas gracilis TaxID=2715279 RepID=UPI00140CE46D|nr:hotdog fold thioesterase [Perlabentimonas gracilis]NHB67418.1 hotdog fold thioesterase [Perlabentimonas gracilis]